MLIPYPAAFAFDTGRIGTIQLVLTNLDNQIMDKHEFVKAVINDDNVIDAFANLYCRWQDECMYEDIDEYGRFLCQRISKIGKADFVEATSQPFGVKVKYGKCVIHFFAKVNGEYLSVCAKG